MKDSSVRGSDIEQQRFSFDMLPADQAEHEELTEPEQPYESQDDRSGITENSNDEVNVNEEITSDVDESVTEQPQLYSQRELPGRVLEAERKRRGFTVNEIAGQLFLSEGQIRALESDNYDHFPAPIFVTGYIRNYARLLDLPPDPLIELLGPDMVQSTPKLDRVTRTDKTMPAQVSSVDPRIIGGVAAVVVVLLLMWWSMSSDDAVQPHLDDVATLDSGEVAPLATREPVAVVSSAPIVPLQPEVKPAPAPTPVVNKPAVVSTPEAVVETAPEPVADVPPQPEFIPDRAAAEGFPDSLELTFTEESWIEITDANGRRVMFGLGKPGQTRALSGTAPFKILFGLSPAVSMRYNGEPFDQSQFARGKVARFTLGGQGDE